MVWIGFAPVALQEAAAPGAVMEALGLQGTTWSGRKPGRVRPRARHPGQVEAARPGLGRIRRLPVSRVLVTAAGGDDADLTRGE
jgi:hypothetical protein